jgi:hypothetical protein
MVVVDASAALKWILDEDGQNAPLELLDEDMLHAPDFLLGDVANVLWSKVRRRVGNRSAGAADPTDSAGRAPTPITDHDSGIALHLTRRKRKRSISP